MDKLIKSVSNIKLYYANEEDGSGKDELAVSTKNERQECCKTMAECVLLSTVKSSQEYLTTLGVTLETLLLCCKDAEADVRIAAEESLNRIINGTEELHFSRVLVEFYKEIKRNGSSRSLRAALSRFSNLVHRIRPSKCRPYIVSLIPVFIRICSREDEGIQECLSNSIAKIFSLIGSFASESEVKDLISALMKNLSHTSAAIRRNSASCIYEVVNNCNKRMSLLSTTLSDLMNLFRGTITENNHALGVITTLRCLVPVMGSDSPNQSRRTGSFGSDKTTFLGVSFESLIVNIFELCAHVLCSTDQSLVTVSLETLQAILKLPSDLLGRLLVSKPLAKSDFSEHVTQNFVLSKTTKPFLKPQNTKGGEDLSVQTDGQSLQALEGGELAQKLTDLEISEKNNSAIAKITSNSSNIYCRECPMDAMTELLCTQILQIGVEKSRNIRVSSKSLALSCIGSILKIRPDSMFLTMGGNNEKQVCEALSFRNFYDPQVRGCVLMLIAQYLQSALTASKGDYNDWVINKSEAFSVNTLIGYICDGMLDESTMCVRASIQSAGICLHTLLWTNFAHYGVKLLKQLLQLKNTSYWLVKVDVLDAFGDVNFRQILFPKETSHDLKLSSDYDLHSTLCDEIMNVAYDELGDKDGRVRKAASSMLVKSIYQKGFVINSVKCDMACSQIAEVCSEFNISEGTASPDQSRKPSGKSLLKTYRGFDVLNDSSYIAHNLSSVIGKISELMTFSTSKDLTQGCIQALVMLSTEFSISRHPYSYECHFFPEPNYGGTKQLTGLLSHLLPLIDSTWPPLEIGAYANAVTLAGNYVAGIACHSFQILGASSKVNKDETLLSSKVSNQDILTSLSAFVDPNTGALALRFFMHISKLLSMLHHIISDTTPSMPNKSMLQTLQAGGSLPGTLKKRDRIDSKESIGDIKSPKKTSSGKTPTEENEKEKTAKNSHNIVFSFAHSRVYMKLYEMLLGTYETYKTTLDSNEVDKFSLFLRTVLDVFSQVLEIVTFEDIEKYTEDILMYLKTIFTVEPTMTVQAVQQLLKGLFGTNFVNQLDLDDQLIMKIATPIGHDHQHHKASFYHQAFHRPLNDFTMAIANSSFHHYLQQENTPKTASGWFGSIKKKVEKKLNMTAKRSKGDKMSIQSYIRLFESIVIKSLKNYTMTSSAEFQKHVLNLLAQLVQLRVNYCLLDSDQIFIGFIVKQFESIESGLVRNSAVLIPHVFFFLVLLSYEKNHSKSVIAMPKIIQLCDGVMASGCNTATHVVPALQPIVHDLFVLRAGLRQDTTSDIDTQREVTQSMLFRIIEYPEVLKMVTTILQYYRKENPEQWKKYSRQVTDVLLPLLSHLKLRVHSHIDTISLHSLIEALSPTALRPIDLVLNIFFMLPSDLGSVRSHQQWIVKINALLRVILCQLKEDFLLQRVHEISVDPDAFSKKVLTITKSGDEDVSNLIDEDATRGAEASPLAEEIITKVCLQIVGFTIERIVSETFNPIKIFNKEEEVRLLVVLLSEFILSLTYVCRFGNFKKIARAMRSFLNVSPTDISVKFYSSTTLCSLFQFASTKYPMASLFWSQFLACVGYMDLTQWGKLTGKISKVGMHMPVLNPGMVNRGAVIMLADYVSQNQSEVEAMSWLIVNHISEVLTLQSEPPIQDFISVIHRNSAASRLFVESIMTLFTRGEKIKTSLKQRLLYCISGLHLKQSDFVVALLLSDDWFVFSPIIAISENSERLACTRLEMLLVQATENKGSPENDSLLSSILEVQQDLDRCERIPRLGRLVGLAQRLKHLLRTGEDDPKSGRRPVVNLNPSSEYVCDRQWYKSHITEPLLSKYHGREIAQILSVLDYEDIMEIFQRDNFDVEKLDGCLQCAFREITQPSDGIVIDSTDMSSPLLSACLTTLVAHLKSFVDQFPDLKVNFCENLDIPTISVEGNSEVSQYWRSVFDVFAIPQNQMLVVVLAKSFTRCLMWQKILDRPLADLAGMESHLLKLTISFHQFLILSASTHKSMDIDVISTCCDFLHQVITVKQVQEVFFLSTNVLYPSIITNSLYALFQHFSEKFGTTERDSYASIVSRFSKVKVSPIFIVLKACQLLDEVSDPSFPAVLQISVEKSLKLVLCHPFFNRLGRVPSLLIKSDVTIDEAKAVADESPANYLSEKDLLQAFISRINSIGWTSRMQFEETWTTLLGVLVSQPIGDISQHATPADETAVQISCLTISSLTALVVSASMKPHGGQPWMGAYPNITRANSGRLPDNKIAHELNVMQCVIDNELNRILIADSLGQSYDRYQLSSNCVVVKDLDLVMTDFIKSRLALNLERTVSSPLHYGIGQKSVRSFWAVHGISPKEEEPIHDSSDDESDVTSSSSERLASEEVNSSQELTVLSRTTPPTPTKSEPFHDKVDTNSCVQFLIDLFSEWFRSVSTVTPSTQQSGSPVALRLPRQFLNECLHSLILISDFFTDRQQFEWMFNSLNSLQLVQPAEDDVMLQYLVLGMCKSAAILGLNRKSCDIVYGMLEAAFNSLIISCQTFALYGALYVLESELQDFMKPLVNLVSKFVHDKFRIVHANVIFHSHQFLRNVISVGCLLIEKAQLFIPPAHVKDFIHGILSLFATPMSNSISNDFYVLLFKTLEALISSFSVSAADCDAIAKFACEQFVAGTTPVCLLSSLNLLVTCLYFHILRMPQGGVNDDDALESRLVSMERIGLLFDKLKTGFPFKSRLLVRILPTLMDNFFSTQDMMNKVIGKFASGLHPQPELIARVLYRVFQLLHGRGESMVVSEWVMLTLRNFTQRTPIWSAIWRLTCIFVSASTDHWIHSTMPLVLKEVNMAPEDRNFDLFYVSSKDFYMNQLITQLDKRSFVSTFQSAAEPGNFYQIMLDLLDKLDSNM